MISQRMRRRVQYHLFKNADVHSNVYPRFSDTSSRRACRWLFEILGEPDKATREEMHLQFVANWVRRFSSRWNGRFTRF